MSKRQAPEVWTGDGRTPARRVDLTVALVEGLRSVTVLALAALEAFLIATLGVLLWASKIDSGQFVDSLKFGSGAVGLLALLASGRAVGKWLWKTHKSIGRAHRGGR